MCIQSVSEYRFTKVYCVGSIVLVGYNGKQHPSRGKSLGHGRERGEGTLGFVF